MHHKNVGGGCHLSKAKFWPLDIHGEGLHLDGNAMVRPNIKPLPTRRRPKLRDVWGPPKMPPTPKDFGPHFDLPAGGSTNMTCGPGYQYFCGAPSQAPYPN
jgi:hypothetical protein